MYKCKICKSRTTTIVESKKEFSYYRCSFCGFIYLDDDFKLEKEAEKAQYDLHNNGFESEGYVQMFENFITEAIAPYLDDIESVFEFGSGPGPVLSELLKRRGLEVDIYDLYYAPKKVYESKCYDLIVSTEVFEHLSRPMEILEMLAEHLTERGYVALMTKFPPKDDQKFLDWWYRRDPTHISFFTPKSFELMAEKVGLKVLKTINENIVVFQKC